MPVATSTERDPGGEPIVGARVIVRLLTSLAEPFAPGYVPSADYTVSGQWETETDAAGVWSTPDIPATSAIVPANSVYVVDMVPPNRRMFRRAFVMPDGAGPHRVEDNLADPPADMPTLLSETVAELVVDVDAAEVDIDAAQADIVAIGSQLVAVVAGLVTKADVVALQALESAAFAAIAGKQDVIPDGTFVRRTADETVGGVKTFTVAPVVPDASFPQAKVVDLVLTLAAKADDADVLKLTGDQTKLGKLTLPNYEFVLGQPNTALAAGNHLYVRKPSGQAAANWYELCASTSFEAGTYRDHTYNFGFGRDATGAKVAGEILLFEQFETQFRETPFESYKAEWHLNFGRRADSFVFNRPIKIDMYHDTGNTNIFLSGDVKILGHSNGVVRYAMPAVGGFEVWDSASFFLHSNANGATPATTIALLSTPGFPSLRFVEGTEVTPSVAITALTTSTKELVIEALGGTIIRNTAGAAARKCLTLTAGAGQSANMLEVQASDQFTRWSYFNKVGRFHTAVATAPVLADLADGEGGLWIDPATGDLKVTSRIAGALKTGTVVVT